MELTSTAHVRLPSELVGEIVEAYLKNQGYTLTGIVQLNVLYNTISGQPYGFEIVAPVKHRTTVDVNIGGLPCSIPVINDTDRGEE